MQVGPLAVNEYTVTDVQLAMLPIILQHAGPMFHQKKQIGGKVFARTVVRLARLQIADLLKMQQTGPGKGGRRVQNSAGVYQFAVKKWCVRIKCLLFTYFFQYNKKVNIMLVFCNIFPTKAKKMTIELQTGNKIA